MSLNNFNLKVFELSEILIETILFLKKYDTQQILIFLQKRILPSKCLEWNH